MSSDAAFAIRREVIEYGALPIASWLGHIDSTSAVSRLLQHLADAATPSDLDRSKAETYGLTLEQTGCWCTEHRTAIDTSGHVKGDVSSP